MSAPRWPVPSSLLIAGLMNHVYEAPYAHLVTLEVPAGLAPGAQLPVKVKLDWLECTTELCVPATATLSTTLTIGDGAADPALAGRRRAGRRPVIGSASPCRCPQTWPSAGRISSR